MYGSCAPTSRQLTGWAVESSDGLLFYRTACNNRFGGLVDAPWAPLLLALPLSHSVCASRAHLTSRVTRILFSVCACSSNSDDNVVFTHDVLYPLNSSSVLKQQRSFDLVWDDIVPHEYHLYQSLEGDFSCRFYQCLLIMYVPVVWVFWINKICTPKVDYPSWLALHWPHM